MDARSETPNHSETTDPWGRHVVLKESAWVHITAGRPQMRPLERLVLGTVARPDAITPDRQLNRWQYWQRGVGPGRWMFVVVGWSTMPAQIVTAYPNRKDPI